MPKNGSSYIELCIQSLPSEKQAKARAAFCDLLEGREDDGTLTRLMIVFEATSAYGRTIPQEMAAVMEKSLRALDDRITQLAAKATASDDKLLSQFTTVLQTQLPSMAKALSSDKLAGAVETLRVSVDRLERSSRRQRNLRLGVVAAFMVIAAAAGVGGTVAWFQKDFQTGQTAVHRFAVLRSYGVSVRLSGGGDQALKVILDGTQPIYDRTWLVNETQQNVGVQFFVPAQ